MVCDDQRSLGFDPKYYRATYGDLAHMSDDEALSHFIDYGFNERRFANAAWVRPLLLSLIPAGRPALEIGPWGSPQLSGAHVRYADVFSTDELKARAPTHGFDPDKCPEINYVLSRMSLDDVHERFDSVFSSHCIEHQPDLVAHLQHVGKLLNPGGRYYLIVPDKRYCFDHFLPESNMAAVLTAHEERRVKHTLASVVGGCALTTHNDWNKHWAGDHGKPIFMERGSVTFTDAIRYHRSATEAGDYIDCHAWQFTPASFHEIMGLLSEIGMSPLKPVVTCATPKGSVEFCAILEKRH